MLTPEQLIKALQELVSSKDHEMAHMTADDLLLEYINDPNVSETYEKILKWYA